MEVGVHERRRARLLLEISQGRERVRYRCRYKVRGDRLNLTCQKRSTPPDFRHAIVFLWSINASQRVGDHRTERPT